MKKNLVIQITRVIAMFMIIICHVVQEFDNKYLKMTGQFFNVGVFIFIFISGYLYGTKKIEKPKKWLISRFFRIMIPVYIFMIFIFGLQIFVNRNFELKYVFIYLFDVQFIFGGVLGAQHLWFLTVIMICYIITLILYRNREKLLKNFKVILLIVFAIAIVLSYINQDLGRTVMYIGLYISAYVYANINKRNKKSIMLLCLAIIGLFGIRIISRKFLDGTVLYNTIIVCFTQILLAYNIYWLINELFKNVKLNENKILNHLDNISYYIYITHMMFMTGPIRTMGITSNMFLNSFISIGLAWIMAIILCRLSNMLYDLFKKEF